MDEETTDTTVFVAGDTFRVLMRQYVAPESTFTWQTGSYGEGRVDTFRYFDNALDVTVERNSEIIVERSLRKEDFASVSGPEFIKGAGVYGAHFSAILTGGDGVRFTTGVFVPDSDVGDFVEVELEQDTVRMELEPVDWP